MRAMERRVLAGVLTAGLLVWTGGCSSLSKTERGAVIGAGAGAAVGGVVGSQTGSTARGVIIGAAVGGAAGALIGRAMDDHAEELADEIEGAEVARVGEGIVVTFEDGILYDFDSAVLRPEARDNLRKLAESLNEHDRTNVVIIGHTDSTGPDAYNQRLSERRADSAAGYLTTLGVTSRRVGTRGMGETDPIASNETAAGQQLNRRVEVVIYANEEWREEAQERVG